MDANSNFLVTCGWSPRQHLGSMLDPLARVFDLKTLMPLPPVTFHVGAAFIRMHPRMLTTGIIASRSGQLQMVDIMNSSMVNVRQLHLLDAALTGLEIAPSGEAMALSDSTHTLQLWGSPAQLRFSSHSDATEFADAALLEKPAMDWDAEQPFSTIGMPHYREVLLSSWPSHMTFEVGAPPVGIDPAILSTLSHTRTAGNESVAYAANPKKTKRNEAINTRANDDNHNHIKGPRFLSEQAKDGEDGRRMSDIMQALDSSSLQSSAQSDVPLMYRNVEIKYSKFGVEDFDFEFYNKTSFSGLETHIPNSYANSLLQLLRFTPVIRNLALQHTAGTCLFETCLLCEMGFLIDMLEKAAGQNCQATNFLKTFGNATSSASLGLLEDSSIGRPLTLTIQAACRYLLDKIASDFRQINPQKPIMDQALTTTAVVNIICTNCSNQTVRSAGTFVHDLQYPPRSSAPKYNGRGPSQSFSQVLKSSVERQEQTRGWCDRCKRYLQLNSQKRVQSIAPVLVINASVHTPEAKQLWAKSNWLPTEIGIIVEQGHFFCYEGRDLQLHLQRGAYKVCVYELVGVVADIHSDGHERSHHLVSMINVASSQPDKCEDNWHLFNDFLVRPIPVDEALRFDPSWKLPSVITYQLKSQRHVVDDSWKQNLDTTLLYHQGPILPDDDPGRFRNLAYPQEIPTPGTAVGIDAEFVALQQEEIEIKADGSRSTLRPSRLGLARVSVLRAGFNTTDPEHDPTLPEAQPPVDEPRYVPFIDDYIHIHEPIVDYLTAFSGIHPGDLSPRTSPHAARGRLISLKTAYKKLWLLLNLGCVFVGHGLPKDFRTINIHVPRGQVIDTVDIFFDRRRARKLSLRFLSWYLLGERVQVEGDANGHDSIEDALMAVRLWEKWRVLQREGKAKQTIDNIYRRGRELGFRVPSVDEPTALLRETLFPGGDDTPSKAASGLATPTGRMTPGLGESSEMPMTPTPVKGSAAVRIRPATDR